MKILYNNLLEQAALSAVNENESYPVSNLIDGFLELRFQGILSTTVITADFTTDQTVSCIALGYHNLSSGSYILKDSGGSTVLSGSLNVAYDTDMTYFTATTCRSIEITLASSTTLYLGGLSVGVPFFIEYWNVNPGFSFPTQSAFTSLRGGQAIGTPAYTSEKWRATLSEITNTQRKEYKEMIKTAKWWPCYADLYEDAHDEQRPIHAILEGDDQFVRDSFSRDYSATIVATEVR